jgi:SpoIID/LytB domain protein
MAVRASVVRLAACVFTLACALGGAASADEFDSLYAPLFPERGFAPRSLPVPRSGIGDVRVQVFPHIGTYTTPQGGETVLDKIGLKSNSRCQIRDLAAERAIGPGRDIPLKTLYPFRFSSMNRPVEVACEGPITVVRQAGLKSHAYNGVMRIYPDRTPTGAPMLRVVNHVSFDTYVRGVIPSEMPAAWTAEALKAQAVAARTYGLWEVLNARAQFPDRVWDIDDTVFYQAYLGLSLVHPATDAASAATAGQYLTHQGSIIKAFFGADSGGHTEDAAHMWEGAYPYCLAKPEIYDLTLVNSDWTKAYLLVDLEKLLREGGILAADQKLRTVSVLDSERYPSGRNSVVHVVLEDGTELKPRSEDFRHAVRLRSNAFSVSHAGKSLTFTGRGLGHGVGMNQWGAKVLADTLGWDHSRILGFYYDGTALCQDPGVPPAPGAADLPTCPVGN